MNSYADNTIAASSPSVESSAELKTVLASVRKAVAPLWPLADYVAVNPFQGLAEDSFLVTRNRLASVRSCDILMPAAHYRERWDRGEITFADLDEAYEQCLQDNPELFGETSFADLLKAIDDTATPIERHTWTVAEVVDRRTGSRWTSHIVNDITRNLSAYYDLGQAAWKHPWKHCDLFNAWREMAIIGHRLDLLGLKEFRKFAASLPEDPLQWIAAALEELKVPAETQEDFLLAELLSVAGWAGYAQYQTNRHAVDGNEQDDLIGLLAIRLACDVALFRTYMLQSDRPLTLWKSHESAKTAPTNAVLARYLFQTATEVAYRRQLCGALHLGSDGASSAQTNGSRKRAQLVFCIDVRSELLRRNLEATSEGIETFGFAGFFGLPISHVPFSQKHGHAHCPVLIEPSLIAQDEPEFPDASAQAAADEDLRASRTFRRIWKFFQTSAVSCFSFVESLGLFYSWSLAESTWLPKAKRAGGNTPLQLLSAHGQPLTTSEKADLAENILRNLGLTENFARLVVFCGHEAETTNNPYQSGLDCGACGGHSGGPNARAAANLLNDPDVRWELRSRGLVIPVDTRFVAGVHNTTTDDLQLIKDDNLPEHHGQDLAELQLLALQAGQQTRLERAGRLGAISESDVRDRARDWSEIRPEWGLAGNAAFVVAPRERTSSLHLAGRTFLHNYDFRQDQSGAILELIMTAPMVVTNWINLQYYASTVDNRAYGSGNKTVHNLVGQFGILSGNGGDLQTGLPWQSVHDGNGYQHEPLRLTVVVEAPCEMISKVIEKHESVRHLVSNGWLTLLALDDDQFFRWSGQHDWIPQELDEPRLRPIKESPQKTAVTVAP